MLERNNPVPLYIQLEEIIREKIENEEWTPHSAIPSENELSKQYGVSRMTARSVISQFVRAGSLYRVQGKGTFVSEPKITTTTLSYMGIREQLERMGYQTTTRLIEATMAVGSASIVRKMNQSQGSSFYVIKRVRYIDNDPISIHTSYIPSQYCESMTNTDLEGEQLCVILDKQYGLKRKRVIETLESSLANEDEAKLLSVKQGYPLLMLEDLIYNAEGIAFEYTKVLFRGDKIKISLQYET